MGEMRAEEQCIVLDYMPTGKSSAIKTEALAQILGKEYFTLLEVTPKPGKAFTVGEEVYVGKEEREKVELIKGRIAFKDLTSNSLSELEDTVTDMVEGQKDKFLNFFNNARAISLKRHQLELLPGLGKKHMWQIIEERKDKEFEDFKDLKARVKLLPDPEKVVIKRILSELTGKEKYCLFVEN